MNKQNFTLIEGKRYKWTFETSAIRSFKLLVHLSLLIIESAHQILYIKSIESLKGLILKFHNNNCSQRS